MKVYSLLCKNLKSIKSFVTNNQITPDKKYLIIIHSDTLTRGEIVPLAGELCKLLPNARVIGCSVGGIIYKGESLTGKTLISIIDLQKTEITCTHISLKDSTQYRSPKAVSKQVLEELGGIDGSFLFAYYSPVYPYVSQLVDQLNAHSKNFKMIGGGAYSITGDLCTEHAYTVYNNEVKEDCLVIAKLHGDDLIDNQSAITGIKSVGRTYKVNKSDGHRLIEIDGKPAKKWFNHIVGEEYLKKDPNIIHALPLVRKDRENIGLNIQYDRDAITGELLGNDLFVFDEVKKNDYLTAGYIDPNSSLAALAPLCEKICKSPTEGIFAYSCLTRRQILHNCAKRELNAFTSTQVAGAFMAGELIYDGKECLYSNSAFTVATLSETPNATINLNLHSTQNSSELQFDNLPLITYLFSTANSELKNEISESKQQLAEQMVTDTETGLANVAKYVYDAKNENFNTLCMLSLKNENVIRVFLDKDSYHTYVISAADCCKRVFGNDCKLYRHGELSLLLAATITDKDEFIEKIKRLKQLLDSVAHESYQPIYEISVAFGEEDLLNKVELTYVNLHKGNKDILINTDDEDDFKQEMNMLKIINDAISHGNVVPFYQGIMNNDTQRLDIYESLMRITDADGRIYMPGDFLPVAKEYKLYDRLSQIMIGKVLDDAPKHDFSVTVNLNTGDIYNHSTLNIIFEKLEKTPHPERIIFEIVESNAITDYDYLKTFTDKIHSLGAKIAIDDFGSGYSNLMHVLRIDLDFIKITGDIVKDAATDPSCLEFINMITSWANNRNKKVVAEYVENENIQRIVEGSNVSYSQGYLFSKPSKID